MWMSLGVVVINESGSGDDEKSQSAPNIWSKRKLKKYPRKT
jgi:hypothetical protein